MSLITPEFNSKEEYDFQKDLAEFATEITNACRNHGRMPPSAMIGALYMIASDLHHNVVAGMQQEQMARAALAQANADKLRRTVQ